MDSSLLTSKYFFSSYFSEVPCKKAEDFSCLMSKKRFQWFEKLLHNLKIGTCENSSK